MRTLSPSFKALLGAAFVWGCGTSQLTLLAVVLKEHGMTPTMIAANASSLTGAVLLSSLASGPLVQRFGAVPTIWIGAAIAFVGIVPLPFVVDSLALTTLATAARGFGFGLLSPPGQMLAQVLAGTQDRTRAIGFYTAMFVIPSFFGPALGEWSLTHGGDNSFFLLAILPMLVSLGLFARLPQNLDVPSAAETAGYLRLLRDRRLWLPNLATVQSGLCWGFATTFLALMLHGQVPLGAFWAPFGVTFMVLRFQALQYLQRLPPPQLTGLGLLCYLCSLLIMAVVGSVAGIACAGILFAIGYGVTMVASIEWSTRLYEGNKRPVALVNTSFQLGTIVAAQLTGAMLETIGWSGVLITLASLVILCLIAMVPTIKPAKDRNLKRSKMMARRLGISAMILVLSAPAFAGDGGPTTDIGRFILDAVSRLVEKLINLF